MSLIFELISSILSFVIFPAIIIMLIVFGPMIVTHKITFDKESKNFSKYTKKNMNIYYRELPSNYSPAIVSTLSNSQIEFNKDLPATILYLCANNYLKLNESNYSYKFELTNKKQDSLLEHEKYILNKISSLNENTFNLPLWQELVIKDSIKLDLLIDTNVDNKTSKDNIKNAQEIFNKFFPRYSITFFCILIIFTLFNYINITFLLCYIFIFLILFPIILTIILCSCNTTKSKFSYKRTKKGEEDYEKWIAFKNFLEDYSLINTRDIKDIAIWEYYLAYAIAFGINKKTIESFDKKVFNNDFFCITNFDKFINSFGSSKSYF